MAALHPHGVSPPIDIGDFDADGGPTSPWRTRLDDVDDPAGTERRSAPHAEAPDLPRRACPTLQRHHDEHGPGAGRPDVGRPPTSGWTAATKSSAATSSGSGFAGRTADTGSSSTASPAATSTPDGVTTSRWQAASPRRSPCFTAASRRSGDTVAEQTPPARGRELDSDALPEAGHRAQRRVATRSPAQRQADPAAARLRRRLRRRRRRSLRRSAAGAWTGPATGTVRVERKQRLAGHATGKRPDPRFGSRSTPATTSVTGGDRPAAARRTSSTACSASSRLHRRCGWTTRSLHGGAGFPHRQPRQAHRPKPRDRASCRARAPADPDNQQLPRRHHPRHALAS